MSIFRRGLLMYQALNKIPKPIASYRCYDKTNDDEDRDVLKDLTGNGHDIKLYNFAYNEESGYNKSTYNGALVSDGVDDYGLCENFPIFTKEKGYTVCAIRKWLDIELGNKAFLSKRTLINTNGAFIHEKMSSNTDTNYRAYNYGIYSKLNDFNTNVSFNFQNSLKYNKLYIVAGNASDSDKLLLFGGFLNNNIATELSSIALYALEIYDHDLTDEEIAIVKERMIAEYEAKTGNVSLILYMEDGSEFLMEDDNSFIIEGNDIR